MYIKTNQQVLSALQDLPDRDKSIYLTSLLINRKQTYLSTIIMKKILGRNYSSIIFELMDKGIIERKSYFISDTKYYYKYWLSNNYQSNTIENTLITNQKLINKINKISLENYSKLPKHIQKMDENLDELIISDSLRELMTANNYKVNQSSFLTEQQVVTPISKGKNGRVFHSVTSLKKIYRDKLNHIDGSQLVEVDGVGAQLICLERLVKNDLDFKRDVINGVFYEKLAGVMNIDISGEAKSDFKAKLMNTFLTNVNKGCVKNSPVGLMMSKLYPITFDYVINMDGSKAGRLQEIESDFFIGIICRGLFDTSRFYVSVHDAIIVKEQDLQYLIDLINKESIIYFGYEFPIKTKYYECATPLRNAPVYIGKGRERVKREVYVVQNDKGVAHPANPNKNRGKALESSEKFKLGYQNLISKKVKPSVRTLMLETGLASMTVRKYLKALDTQSISQEILIQPEAQKAPSLASSDLDKACRYLECRRNQLGEETYNKYLLMVGNEITSFRQMDRIIINKLR